jgi:hypothetical protein
MSYQSSEGSTFASSSLSTIPPLFGAVGSISNTQYVIPATADGTSVVVFQKVLPKGTWAYSASAFPAAQAGQVMVSARVDVGYNYPAAAVILSSFLVRAAAAATGVQTLTSAFYYSDGVTPLQVVVSADVDAGTFSGVANTTNQITLSKIA